jgi:hypothetical protein
MAAQAVLGIISQIMSMKKKKKTGGGSAQRDPLEQYQQGADTPSRYQQSSQLVKEELSGFDDHFGIPKRTDFKF